MSKRIISKSVLAIIMIGFVLSVSSCKKEERLIIGEWKYEKIELKEFACSDPLMDAVFRIGFQMGAGEIIKEFGLESIEFTKDGKFISKKETAKYKVNGNRLTITESNYIPGSFDISFEKKIMYLDINAMELAAEDAADLIESGVTKLTMRVTLNKQ